MLSAGNHTPGTPEASTIRLSHVPPAAFAAVVTLLALYLASALLEFATIYFYVLFAGAVLATALVSFETAFLFVPLAITNPYSFTDTGTHLVVSEFVLLVIFIAWFIKMGRMHRGYHFPARFLVPAVLLILTATFSLAAARYVTAGVLQVIRYVEVLGVLFFVVVNACTDERQMKRIVLSLVIGGFIACLAGIVQFVLETSQTGELRRAYGKHGGAFGAVAASTLLLALGMVFYERSSVKRLFGIVVIPVCLTALLLSQTRAWIGALVLALVIVFLGMRSRGRGKALMFFTIGGAAIALVLQTNVFGLVKANILEGILASAFRFGPRQGVYSVTDISLLMRMNAWGFAIEKFLQNPLFGIGVGNLRFTNYFVVELGAPGPDAGYVDNQYIQFFAEAGVVAGLAWIGYMGSAIFTGFRCIRSHALPSLRSLSFGLFASILVFVLGSFFWVLTPSHEMFAMLVLQIALLMNVDRLSRPAGGTS